MRKTFFRVSLIVIVSIALWQCSEGSSSECPVGRNLCGTQCVSLQNDSSNCGACGTRCGVGEVCLAGVCTTSSTCDAPFVLCGTECVDTRYNPKHCGGCNNACEAAQACNSGVCTGGSCPTGQTSCSGLCVDLRSNPDNCGSCGTSCGGSACYEGACLAECPTGLQLCSGRCVDTTKDEDNCGSCGNACPEGQGCVSSACALNCPTGLTNCSGVCVDTQSNYSHCGTCGHVCGASEVCTAGTCSGGGCPTGLTDCSGSCVDTRTDESHCGGCTVICDSGESCTGGSCGVVCPTGQQMCGARCVDTSTDEANCGTCSHACRADQVCQTGTCACPGDTEDCSGSCVDTQNDPTNCGSCGHACTGSEACVTGSCSLSCPSGLTACGGYCVDTGSDRQNCGGCDIECATDESCVGGDCQTSGVCPADSCSTAIDVSGGGHFTGSTTCAGDDYSGSCGGSSGREIVFKFTLSTAQDVFISTQGSSFDTVIYIRRGVCDSGSDVYCNDDEHGTVQSELNIVDMAAGTYYLFLDSYFSSSYGNYVLDIYMTDPSFEGDRCGDPEYTDIYTVTELSGDTCPWYWFDANPDTEGCSGLTTGKDRLYYFVVRSTTMNVSFSMCGEEDWDTVLYLRSVCTDRAASVACDDDSCDPGLQSTFTASLSPGIYFLWVDGYSESACGGYTVNVSR
jgi:hypothetical protein